MLEVQPCDVCARSSDTIDMTKRDGVVVYRDHQNRNAIGRILRSSRRDIGRRHDDVGVQTNQFGSDIGQPVDLTSGVSILEGDVLAFDVPELAQSLLKGLKKGRGARVRGR